MGNSYIDISSYYGVVEDMPLLCIEDSAILNGYINLLNTLLDEDGISERAFRPNLGSLLHSRLMEPLNDLTAFKIRQDLDSIVKQSSRCTLSTETTITPNFETGSFDLKLVLINAKTGKPITGYFSLNKA